MVISTHHNERVDVPVHKVAQLPAYYTNQRGRPDFATEAKNLSFPICTGHLPRAWTKRMNKIIKQK